MADTNIPVQEAIAITTRAIKEYTDQTTISCNRSQMLDQNAKITAKNNVGIYVQHTEPIGSTDGDIWFDPEGSNNDYPGNNVIIDKTLTKEDQAADAKAVGDALAGKQPIGNYALKGDIPTATSSLINDSAFLEGTDITLSESGKAADAKAVGDIIGNINLILDAINGEVV